MIKHTDFKTNSDLEEIEALLDGAVVLVTGGTGSFGQHFIRKLITRYGVKKLIVYSRDELKQYEMSIDDIFANEKKRIRYFLGDVRDKDRLLLAMQGVDIVIHAAALKQVPALEYNPFEAVKTNIIGSQNVIEASLAAGVKRVVALSTDKAAAPTNLYGASKLVSDKLFISANNYSPFESTRFSVVRYGNVMGSRGSVIPFFISLREKDSVPITNFQMTRFSISLQEGVEFVLQCLQKMLGAELFIPKIPSYRVVDVAKAVCPSSKQVEIGIRPGEKIHEEMITQADSNANTVIEFSNYLIVLPHTEYFSLDLEKHLSDRGFGEGIIKEDTFSFRSDDNGEYLSVPQLRQLIMDNVEGVDLRQD